MKWTDPYGRRWPTDSPQNTSSFDHLRGHVTAFKNTVARDMGAMFYPLPPEQLPDLWNVVLISPAKNLEGVATLAKKAQCCKFEVML